MFLDFNFLSFKIGIMAPLCHQLVNSVPALAWVPWVCLSPWFLQPLLFFHSLQSPCKPSPCQGLVSVLELFMKQTYQEWAENEVSVSMSHKHIKYMNM